MDFVGLASVSAVSLVAGEAAHYQKNVSKGELDTLTTGSIWLTGRPESR